MPKTYPEVEAKFSELMAEDGYDDLKYVGAKLILRDANGVVVTKTLPASFFVEEPTP